MAKKGVVRPSEWWGAQRRFLACQSGFYFSLDSRCRGLRRCACPVLFESDRAGLREVGSEGWPGPGEGSDCTDFFGWCRERDDARAWCVQRVPNILVELMPSGE